MAFEGISRKACEVEGRFEGATLTTQWVAYKLFTNWTSKWLRWKRAWVNFDSLGFSELSYIVLNDGFICMFSQLQHHHRISKLWFRLSCKLLNSFRTFFLTWHKRSYWGLDRENGIAKVNGMYSDKVDWLGSFSWIPFMWTKHSRAVFFLQSLHKIRY